MEDMIRSMRPFNMNNEAMKASIRETLGDQIKPICNVLYRKGEYYIYQAETLMREPGLSIELNKKSKMDRYFVTNTIKRIVGKASLVVQNTKIPELLDALKEHKLDHLKKPEPNPDYSDFEDSIPFNHELGGEGVVLNTGDVIRLGRMCYIVKETSVDLGEEAVQMLEEYA